jgi:glycosyltransferase involved in cell wall biosynthesis
VETHRSLQIGDYWDLIAPGIISSLLDVDVVHCVCYGTVFADLAILVSRLLGKKIFITDVGGRGKWSLVRYIDVSRFVSGLLLTSEFSSHFFARARPGRRVIYGGVDTTMFTPGNSKRQGIVYVGRLLPHKGIEYLIEAIPREYPLSVVGPAYDQEYHLRLLNLAREKTVRFVDAADADVAEELCRSSVAVLPSVYSDYRGRLNQMPEGLGLAVLEAMACETPVVCTTVGALPEIVDDGITGLLVPPNDAAALRQAIDQILEHPAAARRMGRVARRRVLERFTWDRVADVCLRAYRELP